MEGREQEHPQPSHNARCWLVSSDDVHLGNGRPEGLGATCDCVETLTLEATRTQHLSFPHCFGCVAEIIQNFKMQLRTRVASGRVTQGCKVLLYLQG